MLGIVPSDGGGSPPIPSLYCIQWGTVTIIDGFWPCASGVADPCYVNDNTLQAEICGGHFTTTDYLGVTGNTFFYDYYGDVGSAYYQVIRPIGDPSLAVLGTWGYDSIFGNFGPIDVLPESESCSKIAYTATFDVEDVSTDFFSALTVQFANRLIDLNPSGSFETPFDDSSVEADIKTTLIQNAGFEPDVIVEVIVNSPTNVTLTITTILVPIQGTYGNPGGELGTFNFTAI